MLIHDVTARVPTAALRMEAAQDPDDPALAILVGELSVGHEEFRAGGPRTRSLRQRADASSTYIRSSATCRSIAICGTAPTEASSV
jgi:hypothetical protein